MAYGMVSNTLNFLSNALPTTLPIGNEMEQNYRLSLSRFDIYPQTGFIPSRPLQHLSSRFEAWERALESANDRLALGEDESLEASAKREHSSQWRLTIDNMPVLSVDELSIDIRGLQRAHHVLAFLVQFYVHSAPPAKNYVASHIPASLAVPLVKVSQILGIAPVLTFADTVLWNWDLVDPNGPVSISNMRCQTLFTRLKDEEAFYLVSAAIELRGVEALHLIEKTIVALHKPDAEILHIVARSLTRTRELIDELTEILQSVRVNCRTHTFYYAIRPWFRGSDAEGPTSVGWVYQGVDRYDALDLSGPSAGQSTVMHALDIFLNIDHELNQGRAPRTSAPQQKMADTAFMLRMRRYMPGSHRAFLQELNSSPRTVRGLVQLEPTLVPLYDAAVQAMRRFRDTHMRIAVLYIISMARSNSTVRAVTARPPGEVVRGTGGTELANLLKAGRDATIRALLSRRE